MLRPIALVFALFLAGISSANAVGPLPFEQLLYKGRAVPFYGNPTSELQSKLIGVLRQSRLAERMAELTQASLHLRRDLNVGFASCGAPNAFYDRERSGVVFCLELIELMAKLAQGDGDFAMKLDRANFSKLIDGAVWGIFLHELGHAVIDIDRVPITGKEEDVADQFALYYSVKFLEPRDVPVVLPTIWFFRALGKNRDIAASSPEMVKRLLADEHSLDDQRTYNLACWAFGADQSRGLDAAKFVGLPEERARRCPGEYSRLDDGIKSRFRKYLKIKPQ
jgi:hypothetical protein